MARVPGPEADSLRRRHYNAAVVATLEPAPGLVRLRIRPDDGLRRFDPGQHIRLGRGAWEECPEVDAEEPVPAGRERDLVTGDLSFSHPVLGDDGKLLASEEEVDVHEFLVSAPPRTEADRDLRLTPRLLGLKPGDRLHVAPEARGSCTLAPVRAGEDVVFVSTGTGVAPHNAMIWRLLGSGHDGRIGCIVSTRLASEQAYGAIHRKLAESFPSFTYVPLVTRESPDPGAGLRLQELFADGMAPEALGWRPDPRSTRIYLCGNPRMISGDGAGREGMVQVLRRLGFTDEPAEGRPPNLHYEKY